MQKVRKLWNKFVRNVVNIPNKFIIIPMTISAVVGLMLYIPKIKLYLEGVSQKLENEKVKGVITAFIDSNTLIKEAKTQLNINERLILYIIGAVLLVTIFMMIIKVIYINKEVIDKIIIGHMSMSQSQFNVETDDEYRVEYIDLIEDMKDTKNDYEKITYAIKEQDESVEEFKESIVNSHKNKSKYKYEYGYMGIAHTPLILRMGNQIGDEVGMKLFHKSRTEGENTSIFAELSRNEDFKSLSISMKNLDKDSHELIVGLSTTFEIKYSELSVFNPDDKNIIIFNSEELGFDVIKSSFQVKHYVEYIMSNIRDIAKEKNISNIHMVLSTSSVMTFALGQAISLNNNPNVIIYHYDMNNPRKYTWGIDLSKDYRNCLVTTTECFNTLM